MSIFAIGDLHLPGSNDKAMDIFGDHWDRHFETIQANWRSLVTPEDVVLIPGDISWAMQLRDVLPDLQSIGLLPGRKVLIRGNHDYWWSSIAKVRASLPEGMYALQNDALVLEDTVFCGTRGWIFPTAQNPLAEEDQKIFQRELMRLEMSLEAGKRMAEGKPLIVLMHFPPVMADGEGTAFSGLLERYNVKSVVYGHLHGIGIKNGFCGVRNGVRYQLCSCDALGFSPILMESTF